MSITDITSTALSSFSVELTVTPLPPGKGYTPHRFDPHIDTLWEVANELREAERSLPPVDFIDQCDFDDYERYVNWTNEIIDNAKLHCDVDEDFDGKLEEYLELYLYLKRLESGLYLLFDQ